ncbi:MAG: hypothetical protein ABEJ67_04480 [Halanaeroarchaeum sp.]
MSTYATQMEWKRLANAVREDAGLTRFEKETAFTFTKADSTVSTYSEEGGLMRRLLLHPVVEITELRVNHGDTFGVRVHPEDYTEGAITGVRAEAPIGLLKLMQEPRRTEKHSEVVSREVLRDE